MNKSTVWLTTVFILLFGAGSVFGQSEEAKRHFDYGEAAVKIKDYEAAIKEFEQAARLAPNWPDVFYDLGLAQEGAEKYADAVKSYREYLRLAPNASDAEETKSLINKLEAKKDEAGEVKNIFQIMASGGYERKLIESNKLNGKSVPFPVSQGFRMVSGEMQVSNYWYNSESHHPQSHPPIPRQWEPVTVNGNYYEFSYSYYMDSVITRTDPPSAYVTRHDVEVKGEIVSIDPPRIKELVTVSINWGAPIEGNRQPWSADFNEKIEEENTYELVIRNVKSETLPPPISEDESYAERLIADVGGINSKDNMGFTPLHLAVNSNKIKVAELLIAKGADISGKDIDGKTPLFGAAFLGKTEMAKFLITKGADVNAKDIDGKTPLFEAMTTYAPPLPNDKKEMAMLLIAEGADVNAKDKFGSTPLVLAACLGAKEVAETLIAKGADINVKNKDGWTPLHEAAATGQKDVAELLISKGADINATDIEGKTPLQWAKIWKKKEVVALLKKHGAR